MAIRKQKRDKIIAQALDEIQFARTYRQGKVGYWQKNEDLYYGKKLKTDDARANVDLARMQEFVHTLLSKIDNPLTFKFLHRKPSQKNRAERLNSLRAFDSERDHWDIKDIVGKKQAIIYGRAIYSYYADSSDSYKAHLDNVDVYDFLIDPSAGGIDIEKAFYLGRYGVIKTRKELEELKKDSRYVKTEIDKLLRGNGNAFDEGSTEETNKTSRTYNTNVYTSQKEIQDTDKFKFWQWYTTYEGVRYSILITEEGGCAIRVQPLKEVFESELWPFWTWAAFPDLTEFWTPSYADYVREIFMAQAVSINQMLDNAEQINKPQKVIDVTAIENFAELKYRKDGYIKSKGPARDAVEVLKTPSIDTPIKVFEVLETIQEKSSGVTAGAKGLADGDEKATIYEGNQANVAERFGFLNKSYSFGYKRFAKLYEHGVREHLNRKTAIDVMGPEGVSIEEVSKRDIFRKDDQFGIMVEASDAETRMSLIEKKIKNSFLQLNAGNPVQNPEKAYEISAQIAGFSDEVIRHLMDTDQFGDADIMAEAERDIEMILDGKTIEPNQNANIAYKQKLVDYINDHEEDIDDETFEKLAMYIRSLDPVINRNLARKLADEAVKLGGAMEGLGVEEDAGQSRLPRPKEDVGELLGEQENNATI